MSNERPTMLGSARLLPLLLACLSAPACLSPAPSALREAEPGPGPVVRFDVYHRPLPEIPLPNDFATRFDETSPTLRRLNASIMVAPTRWEQATRAELDRLTGWGTLAPITVGFSAPIDPEVIFARHHGDRLDFSNDAVLVLDVTPGSPGFCEAVPLDLGQGNYPQTLQGLDIYASDPRAALETMSIEETEEDLNRNGVLDPGEDTDMDGVLDHPNTRDGRAGSTALDFYERESNTLIMKPLVPMRERTTYAAVITTRLTSPDGDRVRSPFAGINHTGQTEAMSALPECLARHGLGLDEVAFTWSFTTQSISHDYQRIRDGLYGQGELKQVGADFPARVARLADVQDPGPGVTNTKILPASKFNTLAAVLLQQFLGGSDEQAKIFLREMSFVDYIVAGELDSPQFFPRVDAAGARLPFYDQVFDLGRAPRAEKVPFWIFVPKNRKGPAPVAIFVHGHGGSKFDGVVAAGWLAHYGVATIAFDAPSHGVGLDEKLIGLARLAFANNGLAALGDFILAGRAFDWDGDGKVDPGSDYWTSYVFHSRDMVRQTMVDFMQVVRMLRGFDGARRWDVGVGLEGLAGDFDGDGVVDVGGAAPLHVLGGSLGGITGGVAAGIEPELDTGVAFIPGGMLSEVGPRSTLGGVRDAMLLRALGPLFTAKDGVLQATINGGAELNVTVPLHALPPLAAQDTVVLHNTRSGEHRCGAVQPSGTFRVSVAVDAGDTLRLRIYRGPLPPQPLEGCALPADDVAPYVDITDVDREVRYDGKVSPAGAPLVALADGFGLRRATPDLRRFLGLAQIALESADPMNWAPYWDGTREMRYGTGEVARTRVLVAPSIGDTGVAVACGIALGRAAGFIDFTKDDPRYGKPANQVLIDTWATEGLERTARYRDSKGSSVLMDIDHLAATVPVDDGYDVPRLDPPLRLVKQHPDGSYSGFFLSMLDPKGKHGVAIADGSAKFDLGSFFFNVTSRYVATSGREFSWDGCQATSTCAWIPAAP